MFDPQNTGQLDIHQFSKLFEYINQWLNIFKTYDRNGSGQIDDQELNQGNGFLDIETNSSYKRIFFCYFSSIFSDGFQFLAKLYKEFDQPKP